MTQAELTRLERHLGPAACKVMADEIRALQQGLDHEKDSAQRALDIARSQALTAMENMAKERNENVHLSADRAKLLEALRIYTNPLLFSAEADSDSWQPYTHARAVIEEVEKR